MSFQNHLAALPWSSSHLALCRDRENPQTPEHLPPCSTGNSIAGSTRCGWGGVLGTGDEAEHSPRSCPTLLWKNCSACLVQEHLCARSQLCAEQGVGFVPVLSLFVPFPRVTGCRTPAHGSINPPSSLSCSSFNKRHSRFYLKSSLQMALMALFGLCLLWQQVMDRAGAALSL